MHSFVQMNGQHQQVGPPSQAAPHAPHDATRSCSANNVHQYIIANSGVQPSQNVYFASQIGVYPNRQMANLQNSEGLPLAQSKTGFLPITCGSQISTLQHSRQYTVNQSLPNPSRPNTTYPTQNMSVCWSQSSTVNEKLKDGNLDVPHLQQNGDSRNFYLCSAKSNSSYTTSTPSLLQYLIYKPSSLVSAAPQNVQTSQRVSNQNFRPSCVESGHSSVYTQNCSMGTSQSFGSNSAAPQSFSNGQLVHFSNTSQMTQQSATLTNSSYYNCEASTNSRNANLNDQNNSNSFLRDTNELPINSSGAQQQMLGNQGSADSLGNSYTISNGYCLPPPRYESHFADESRMSNQNIQPVTSARSESYNLNASQPLSLHSRQSLPQSVMSRGHHTVNPHPQQNTLSETFNVNTAEDRGEQEKAANVSLSNGNAVSKQYLARSLSDGPQVQQTPKKRSTQKNDLRLIYKNHPHLMEILGFHPTVQLNDSSAHSGKAHTGARAVAVVPPLSQDDGQTSPNNPTCNSINGTDKERITPDVAKEAACVEETNLDQEMPNPVRANKAASSEVAVLIDSDCVSQRSEQDDLNPTAQRCSEVSPSQTSPEDQSETATSPSPPVFDLSSLPTNAWTMKALNDLLSLTKASKSKPKDNLVKTIMVLFWDKNIQAFLQSYNAVQDFYSDVEKVCAHFKQDTVILSQVKCELNDPLKPFHVLKDDEVYSEQPYKSFWLNLNDKLDDIDKEFGFPWALMQNLHVQDSYSQLNIDDGIHKPVANEVQNKVLSQLEPESAGVIEETEAPAVVDSSTPPMSPDESEDASSDLRYSFKIEVLPSEEAKALYEEAQKQINQGAREELMILSSSSQTEDNDTDATLTSKTKSFEQIKEICCLSRLMEMYSLPVESPCRCLSEDEQSCNGITVGTLNPDTENSPKSKDNETITLTAPQLVHKLDQIIDFLDDDNNFFSPSSEMSLAISQTSSSSQENIDSVSDCEDKDIFATVPDISNEIIQIQSEDESPKKELESTRTTQTSPSASSTKQNENDDLCSTETDVILLSDQEEYYEQTLVKAAEEAASPLESKEMIQTTYQTSFSHHVRDETPEERRKRRRSHAQFFPGLKTPKKCKTPANLDLLDVPKAQPAASEKQTVELVLFGLGQQERGSLSGNKSISSQRVSCFKDNPPEVLSVNMFPSKRIPSKAGHTENYSVKQLIYERWRKSVPNLNGSVINGHKKKLKRQKHLYASRSTSSKEEQQQSVSDIETPDSKNKGSLSLKKRSLSYLCRLDEAKRKKYSVTLGQPANQEAKEVQDENIHSMPLQENIILKFSVLPNTFSFKEGSNLMETTDPVSDETKLVKEKDQSPEKTSTKSKGMWSSTPAHQQQPLDAPKTVGLFYEYQKKYKEKTLSSSGD